MLGLYGRLSDESIYLRFFSPVPRPTAARFERLTNIDYLGHMALAALIGDDIVAVARYDAVDERNAEVAFTVEDDQHGRGIATLLLEHLAVVARANGIDTFVADTLPHNYKMLNVFAAAGWEIDRRFADGTVRVRFPIEPTELSLAAIDAREHISEARSMSRILSPASIAVIGASRERGTVGNAVFRNLLSYGFEGPVFPVNPATVSVAGVRAYGSVLDVPDDIDLAVIVVPAPAVAEVVEQCAKKHVRGLVIISAGFAETGDDGKRAEREVVAIARTHGMRVIGPNCLGLINTSPNVRMNASFSPVEPRHGNVSFLSQSGGLGIELMARAARLDLGVSTFVSVGNKSDVSSNDLLQHWADDPETGVILLYLESFGNPRKFARLARRVAREKPIVAVKSGRTRAGTRAASSHTAALATPDVAVDALFRQAGVIRVDRLEQLFETAQVLAHQPLPPGRRVAIVGNTGGPLTLAADACAGAGLDVPELSPETQARLREFVSNEAAVRNPVDLVAGASAGIFERALRVVLSDDNVDALLVVFVPPIVTGADDVAAAIAAATADAGERPVIACFLGREGMPEPLRNTANGRPVPSFAFPEAAAAALSRAADLADWRRRPEGVIPTLDGIDIDEGRAIARSYLHADHSTGDDADTEGLWLPAADAARLCAAFGIPVAQTYAATSAGAAVEAAEAIGYPVALKADAPTILHTADIGGVMLGLASATSVRDAYEAMERHLGAEMGGVTVQPMVPGGVETIVGVTHDASFGPLVLFGMGGTTAELLGDRTLRILPLTDEDAHEVVRSLRGSPLLFGYRGRPEVDVAALEDVLLRVGRLAEDVPEVAEMDLNPVIVAAHGVVAVDVKVRVAPPQEAFRRDLRRLRM
ncbi:MAG: family N-acetyltransferase [Actinomycetia bacterium]|nr:family N-acetyltransferase [Actinomycetes bacterium]